ncbi:hypothetical protein NMY22_g499 [Coprinellus aureogranulatus]|nr:hypothetical protein NMY22_g499 [Coprinellus aureogranulatus]
MVASISTPGGNYSPPEARWSQDLAPQLFARWAPPSMIIYCPTRIALTSKLTLDPQFKYAASSDTLSLGAPVLHCLPGALTFMLDLPLEHFPRRYARSCTPVVPPFEGGVE